MRRSFLHRTNKHHLGMTLMEVMVAITVTAVGIMATMASLWFGVKSERYSERRTHAVFQARELLSVIRTYANVESYLAAGSEFNDGSYDNDSDDLDPARQQPFNATPLANYFPNNPYNFRRHVEMKRLAPLTGNDYRKGVIGIKVILFWDEGGHEKHLILKGYR